MENNNLELLYSAAGSQQLDSIAINDYQLDDLMEKAGSAAFKALHSHWHSAKTLLILCGVGNNGGDGFVVARLAHNMGLYVTVVLLGPEENIKGEARQAYKKILDTSCDITDWSNIRTDKRYDVIVDAMLGTGVCGELRDNYLKAVQYVNNAKSPVLALDVPTGLNPDTGEIRNGAVMATLTICFIALKQGCYLHEGPKYCGQIIFSDLGIPNEIYSSVTAQYCLLSIANYKNFLPTRQSDSHKGQQGHVVIVGSELQYSGAVRLSAMAALRSGAGLVTIATRAEHAASMNQAMPELMVHGIEDMSKLIDLLKQAKVIILGPGLGQTQWSKDIYTTVLTVKNKPMIMDADALNLLSQNPEYRDNWVLTPHPGEASRLLSQNTQHIQQDRKQASIELVEKYGGTVVLKGHNSLIQSKDRPTYLCCAGNPGMAVAGMGDLLTGIIAALIAQGLDLENATCLGVLVHATAGDRVAKGGMRGIIATDLLPAIKQLVNSV